MNKIKLGNKDIYYQVFYKNNKNMYLRVKEDRLVITCNSSMKQSQIENFIQKNSDKILRTITNHNQKEELYNQDVFLLFGLEIKLDYTLNNKKNSYKIIENEILINFKQNLFDEKYIEKIYQELLMQKIDELLLMDLKSLNENFDIKNTTFKTQLMKSRFGSCIASKKIIKINTILARLDIVYLKTILIHEIIHLKVHNHQREFYKYIDLLIPNYKQIIKSLNQETRKYVI